MRTCTYTHENVRSIEINRVCRDLDTRLKRKNIIQVSEHSLLNFAHKYSAGGKLDIGLFKSSSRDCDNKSLYSK